MELEVGNSEEYEIEAIWNSMIYAKESVNHLLELYYLVLWKGYSEEENTWEPASAVQHLRKLINLFYKDHLNKPTAIFEAINTDLLMVRLIVRPTTTTELTKQKLGRLANSTHKWAKKNRALFGFYRVLAFFQDAGNLHIKALSLSITWFQ